MPPSSVIPLSTMLLLRLMRGRPAEDAYISSKELRQDVREYNHRFELWATAKGFSANPELERPLENE
jgi:hypothetical protein